MGLNALVTAFSYLRFPVVVWLTVVWIDRFARRYVMLPLFVSGFNKSHLPVPSSPPSLPNAVHAAPSTPAPAQQHLHSREALHSSRFFASPSTSYGNVLVPNSSPLGPDANYRPYHLHNSFSEYDVAKQASGSQHNMWGSAKPLYGADPLMASSGFVTHTGPENASLRRAWAGSDSSRGDAREEGPPRKRINRGPSVDPVEILSSPESPDIKRPSARRRAPSAASLSSDESMPDVSVAFALPKSRLVRERPVAPSPAPSESVDDPKFLQFKITNPLQPAARVQAAWQRAGGDTGKANALLSDPNWSPTSATPSQSSNADEQALVRFKMTMPEQDQNRVRAAWNHARGDVKKATDLVYDPSWSPPSKPPTKPLEDTGKVKEIDEANKAQRAAMRDKGKKSAIYANRPSSIVSKPSVLATPPSSSKVDIDLTANSPTSPVINKRSRLSKRLVVASDSEAEPSDESEEEDNDTTSRYKQALDYFNQSTPEAIMELTGCTKEQAETIVDLRPFDSVDDLNAKLGQNKKKAGPKGISSKMFEECSKIFEGYDAVDKILEGCEKIGTRLRNAIAQWGTSAKGKGKEDPSTSTEMEDGALSLRSLAPAQGKRSSDYMTEQPSLLSDDIQLKDYQLLGVNWLNLMYRQRYSCILADEMGLGKTAQVISFLALLKERGKKGPHLVVVPSSTLENWCREFQRFAPSISYQTYYASKEERSDLRTDLLETQRSTNESDKGWEVLITTYNLVQGDERDRKFFRRIEWDCSVFDEGHVLKNFQSQRYQALMKYESRWRLLLTGTPLQNNLQELVSLMNFILPEHFANAIGEMRAIFKAKGDSNVTLLAQQRVSRAKKMMTPFVLRRRKDQVLKDLPKKTERIEWCTMTKSQSRIYGDTLRRSRKTILDSTLNGSTGEAASSSTSRPGQAKKAKAKPRQKDKMYSENSSNVLMDLRKAASHPMLFRTLFTDEILNGITKQLLKEPDFKRRGALFELVKEDMSVMTDAELQVFSASYKSTRRYLQDEACYVNAGKVVVLLKLLKQYAQERRKVLIFSQFTQILDILQTILKQRNIKYLLLTGSTPVDARQSLVDEFTEDDSIWVFLLSTKAGGMGINLTAASVVIMFDQDFNPHNDKQAQDRAYRIGQKRDVDVVKLITRNTIEEDMLKMGQTKLRLDEAVAGDSEENSGQETAQEREMKTSLMNLLRQQLEQQETVEDTPMDTT
ncbi:hypothetical protein ONZ45_g1342 [Pleurotus djamor]|nr:hypothetical protein ONZ45_g1342 [Pleurotus djamor]